MKIRAPKDLLKTVLLGVIAGNFVFISVDVALAHTLLGLSGWPKLWPVWAGCLCGLLIGLRLLEILGGPTIWKHALNAATALALFTGAFGFYFHLDSRFLQSINLHSLVYSAPIAAPLAFSGLGLLAWVANRGKDLAGLDCRSIALALVGWGFLGNAVICLMDHEQNAFFFPSEWIGVAAGLFAGCVCLEISFRKTLDVPEIWIVEGVFGLVALVGVLGFAFHLHGGLGVSGSPVERFVHGVPIMAPLIFVDLALLGWIILRSRQQDMRTR